MVVVEEAQLALPLTPLPHRKPITQPLVIQCLAEQAVGQSEPTLLIDTRLAAEATQLPPPLVQSQAVAATTNAQLAAENQQLAARVLHLETRLAEAASPTGPPLPTPVQGPPPTDGLQYIVEVCHYTADSPLRMSYFYICRIVEIIFRQMKTFSMFVSYIQSWNRAGFWAARPGPSKFSTCGPFLTKYWISF